MDKRTADRLHKAGIKAGRVVSFYTPKPNSAAAPADVPEVASPVTAADILREVLGNDAEGIGEIVIIMRDKQGIGGLVSNMSGAGESFMFLEQVKLEILQRMRNVPPPQGPQTA